MKTNIQYKYTSINHYFNDRTEAIPIFIKLTACILFLRKKLGFSINIDPSYYKYMEKIETQVFCNIETEDLQELLDLFIKVMCEYMQNTEILEGEGTPLGTPRGDTPRHPTRGHLSAPH